MVAHFGLDVVRAYMRHVQDNAEECVRRVIGVLKDGEFAYEMDNGAFIRVKITIGADRRSATIDFTGTSPAAREQLQRAGRGRLCGSALRLPHPGGRRHPAQRRLPQAAGGDHPRGLDARPRSPAATVAGNVETSQCLTDALYGALGVMAASYGTMNNFTFGNDRYQYYETISGGTGAGEGFDGTDTVQAHMTNSRLTDPEVLEWRYPVRIDGHEIRARQRRRGQVARRQRRHAPRALPRADDGGDPRGAPANSALRNGGRLARRPRAQLGGARGRLAHGAFLRGRDTDGRGRRVRDRNSRRRRLRRSEGPGMRRRFLAATAGAIVAALSRHALAQAAAGTHRLGILGLIGPQEFMDGGKAKVLAALADLGYVRGRNLEIDERYAQGREELLAQGAAQLAALKVDAILTEGTPATLFAQRATRTIPIVTSVGDPVAAGFARELARPGANVTGLSQSRTLLAAKQVEMLVEVVRPLHEIAVLYYDLGSGDRPAGAWDRRGGSRRAHHAAAHGSHGRRRRREPGGVRAPRNPGGHFHGGRRRPRLRRGGPEKPRRCRGHGRGLRAVRRNRQRRRRRP